MAFRSAFSGTTLSGVAAAAFFLLISPVVAAKAQTVLEFQVIAIPGNIDQTDTKPVRNTHREFALTAANPLNGLSVVSQTAGSKSTLYAGSQALAAFAPAARSDNGQSFSVLAVDPARDFAFDPAPSDAAGGHRGADGPLTPSSVDAERAGGGPLQGQAVSRNTRSSSLEWGHVTPSADLLPSDDIRYITAIVPESGSAALLAGMGMAGALYGISRRRRRPSN